MKKKKKKKKKASGKEKSHTRIKIPWGQKKKYPRSRNVEQKSSLIGVVLGLIQLTRRAQLRKETSPMPILCAAASRNE